jgi:poly(3-hydroxybutyrate) depolymerase
MVYLKSLGNDWTGALSSNYTRFDAAYTELTNEHCIETGRVLAIGHSSGAQFISNLVCRPEPRLRGVAPVASSPYGQTCPGIPALIIHGNCSESPALPDRLTRLGALGVRTKA